MSKSTPPLRRNPLYPVMITALIITAISIAAWMATSAPALGLEKPVFTPTHIRSFAFAEIAKPTYTALPTATGPPTQTPTVTPEPMVQAEIVLDTPTSEYVAPIAQDDAYAQTPLPYGGNKYILIDISEQHMYVYEGDALVFSFVSSTGMNNSTRVGNFSVLNKIPNAYGATWNIWMPNWLGIYWSGSLQNGIHALPILPNGGQLWAGYLGVPISYGCIVLGAYESQLLYDWSEIGTPVEIRW
ncbi:MAG: L,D-transpeptidase [Anaerolineales bacterium]